MGQSPRIVVVGSINMDLVVRAPLLPRPGQTVLGSRFSTAPGGKGANQAVACARMGAQVSMVGRVGDDHFGAALLGELARAGVDCTHVTVTPGEATGVGLIVVEEGSGQNAIVVAPGANASVSPEDVDRAAHLLDECDALVLQLEIPMDTVVHAARMVHGAGRLVVLNPAPATVLDEALLSYVDVLVPNETEAASLAGIPSLDEGEVSSVAESLRRGAVRAVIITMGARGAWVSSQEFRGWVQPFQVRAVDATAAGDAFVGALATLLAQGAPMAQAVTAAAAAGALATTVPGAMPSLPGRASVEALVASLLAGGHRHEGGTP